VSQVIHQNADRNSCISKVQQEESHNLFRFFTFFCPLTLLAITLSQGTLAEEKDAGNVSSESAVASTHPAKVNPVKPAIKSEGSLSRQVSRWFVPQLASIEARYTFRENSQGITTTNQLQHKESFIGRLKLDTKGNYSINAGVFSGSNFIASWNASGWGTGNLFTNLYLKQLYFAAKPVKPMELQYGGLYVTRGESTEVIGYDNDAYLMGQRLSLYAPEHWFFDEVLVTYAYLGDDNRPNINKRFFRLKASNYHQFLVGKKLNKRIGVSADYTFLSGAETLRQAIKVGTKELKILDSVLFEDYQRTDVSPAYGCNLYGEKSWHRRFTLGGGFASIDPNFGMLNSDRFGKGKRVYLTSHFVISSELTVSTFLARAVTNDFPVTSLNRFDLVLSYNLLKSLQHAGLF
jgi:hypothetical protein